MAINSETLGSGRAGLSGPPARRRRGPARAGASCSTAGPSRLVVLGGLVIIAIDPGDPGRHRGRGLPAVRRRRPRSSAPVRRRSRAGARARGAVGVDEYREVAYAVTRSGDARARRRSTGNAIRPPCRSPASAAATVTTVAALGQGPLPHRHLRRPRDPARREVRRRRSRTAARTVDAATRRSATPLVARSRAQAPDPAPGAARSTATGPVTVAQVGPARAGRAAGRREEGADRRGDASEESRARAADPGRRRDHGAAARRRGEDLFVGTSQRPGRPVRPARSGASPRRGGRA